MVRPAWSGVGGGCAICLHALIILVLILQSTIVAGDQGLHGGLHPWEHQPYYPDYGSSTNHVYQDPYYSSYWPTNSSHYAATGYSTANGYSTATGFSDSTAVQSTTDKVKRFFTTSDLSADLSVSFSLYIPLTDISSSIYVSTPFYWSFPSSKKRADEGRSLGMSANGLHERKNLYSTLETYIERYTGTDGHVCLLRAMCEVGSTPDHDDGLLGDVINMLLTASHAFQFEDEDSVEMEEEYKEYLGAQAKGQLSGDCSEFYEKCPLSLFKFVDNFI